MPALIELPTFDTLREEQRLLRAQLANLRRRLHLQLILELAAEAIIAITAAGAALIFLDWFFRFGLQVRVLVLALSVIGLLAFLGLRAVTRWRTARLDELSLALILDRHRPGIGQQIADVLQLPDLLGGAGGSSSSSSPAMVRLAVQQASAALASSDWRTLWNRKRTALHAGGAARRPGRALDFRGSGPVCRPVERAALAARV